MEYYVPDLFGNPSLKSYEHWARAYAELDYAFTQFRLGKITHNEAASLSGQIAARLQLNLGITWERLTYLCDALLTHGGFVGHAVKTDGSEPPRG